MKIKRQPLLRAFEGVPSREEGKTPEEVDSVMALGIADEEELVCIEDLEGILASDPIPIQTKEVVDAVAGEGEEVKQQIIQRSRRDNGPSLDTKFREPCSDRKDDNVENCIADESITVDKITDDLNENSENLASSSSQHNSHSPPASGIGRFLTNNLASWKKLPKSSFACDIIINGVRLPFVNKLKARQALKRVGPLRYYSPRKRRILEEECNRLLSLGVIEEIPKTSFFYSNYIFYKIKPDGTIRLIFDMKCLNTLLKKPSFSMLKSKSLFPYLHLNSWACKLDLQDAYWHIPLHSSAKRFLTFQLGKRKFRWMVVPFGLKTAPYIFSKIMYTVIKYIRSQYNILIFCYLDDILILAKSFLECKSHIQIVIQILSDLGWKISHNKSITEPAQEIEFLGVYYDLVNKTMKPMQKNIDKSIKITNKVLNLTISDLKLHQRLIGSLSFCSSYTLYGCYYLKFLHRFHYYFSQGIRVIPPSFKNFLEVWNKSIMYREICIPKSQVDLELYTDASNLGWGGALAENGEITSIKGTWSSQEYSFHINVKELLACVHSVKIFKSRLYNKVLLIHIDSKVTLCWIRKLGSIKNELAHALIKELLEIMEKFNIQIRTRWIKGTNNILADSLSREAGNLHPEVSLSNSLYNLICKDLKIFPEIDLFTDGLNSKCIRFCSSVPNPNSICINAFNINWGGSVPLYAFPPGHLLSKVVFKINRECNNNMLFCVVSQGMEPWIPLVMKVAKKVESYKIRVEGSQIVQSGSTIHSALPLSSLIAFKI